MAQIKYTLNKNDLTKEEQEKVSKYYRGFTALRDTLTEETFDDAGNRTGSQTFYIFKGGWTPYGACVKHGDKKHGFKYVFARHSRYDAVTTDFTEFLLDCDDHGNDDDCFETHHFSMNNNTVEL